MKFTAEEAREQSESGAPIMVELVWAQRQIAKHGARMEDFLDSTECSGSGNRLDAWKVLEWLGY